MNPWIIALYIVALASFVPPMVLAWYLRAKGQVPLASHFLRIQASYFVFLLALLAAYVGLSAYPAIQWQTEVFFNTLFFVLYANLVEALARFLFEIVQRPWSGPWKSAVHGVAVAGIALPLLVHATVFEGVDRALVLRWVLNGAFFVMFMGIIAALFTMALRNRTLLRDEWKRRTLGGASLVFFLGLPLFIVDALWPVLQWQTGWIPRGLNLQVIAVLAWNGYFTWRWFSFSISSPAVAPEGQPSEEVLSMLTGREREIALLLVQGRSNQEICDRLGVRMGTTKNHIYNIFNKTGASSRKEFSRMLLEF